MNALVSIWVLGLRIFPQKWCGQVAYHVSTARVPRVCQFTSTLSTCIMSSEGPESTDITSEQAQQESASILNVLRESTPADISVEHTNVFDHSCFDSYNICPLVNC